MTSYSLVALDMAGTTVDEGGLVYTAIADAVAESIGTPVPADVLQRWKGTSKEEAIGGILGELGEDASPSRVAAVFQIFMARVEAAYRESPPTPIPGVLEMFDELRAAGVRIALQTGYTAEVAGSILTGLGWTVGGTVDALVTSDTVAASRPAPYLVFHAMEATGVTDVRRVLTAGDTPNDLGAGMNAGARFVVGVTTGSFTREQLLAEPHTHILDSVAELPTLL
ncbi:MAG: phosphonatase-like hydrolase [Nocardioidaceae bacterium]|nr:phosphonatase-like hydrolase [Nocardioidaceae bacterium]MCL2613487.1 phosphonatase-like hydrolase [Nocardioidaceae bacterium]